MSDSSPIHRDPRVPAPPPDDQNPAVIFAHKTFLATVIGAGLFLATVVIFIL